MGNGIFPNNATVLLFVILIVLSARSASGLEKVILIPQTEHYSLGPNLSYLEDHQGKLSIDMIRSSSFTEQWQRNTRKVPAFGFTSSVYWFAVELENRNTIPIQELLELSYPLLDSVGLYLERKGQIVEQFHTGDQQLFANRPIEHRHFLFPVHLEEKDSLTLYLRIQTNGAMQIPLVLWNERAFWKANQSALILQGVYFGIMLVMTVYNLFIYTVVRDRSYIYYVLFVGCFAVFQFTLHGFSYHYFWPNHPWFNQKILLFSVVTALMVGGLFTINLLGLKQQSFKLYWLMIMASLIALLNGMALPFLEYKSAVSIALANSILMASLGLTAGSIMWKRDYTPARFYTIAWMGLLTGTIAFALNKFGVIPRNVFTENGIQFGSVIEVILLSFALANRINSIRKEKELAQAETVSILEKYQTLYESALEGIFQSTLAYKFVSANQAMIEMLGLPNKDSLLSDNLSSLRACFLNQDEADRFFRLLQNKGEVINHEFRAQKHQGDEFWASISARTINDEDGKPKYFEGSLVDITIRRQAQEQVRYQAYYDDVTGLPNRTLLQDLLHHALERAKRNDELVAVLFVDLNRFKLVNDTFGHDIGDKLLQEVATRLTLCLRGGDWVGRPKSSLEDKQPTEGSNDAVARLGGDEFVMVLTDIRHAEDAAIVAWRVGKTLAKSFTLNEKEIYISASIGISSYPVDSDNPTTLLKQADAAMYHVKKQGIDGYQFHSDYFTVHASKRLAVETELRQAINNNEFQLYYQPKLDLQNDRIVGVEALCRWQHPKRGLVLPQEFIGIAEEIGLIVPIGEWVLQTACEQNKIWQNDCLPTLTVSVNISARQFLDPELSESILRILNKSGLNPGDLELELTESTLMDDTQATGKLLDELKDMGLFLSIDDFGTGYSSLSYLKRFPVDILKIDRSFIQDITQEANNRGITSAIISMAQQLELKVTAEGVETEAQMNYLREQKCDQAQGYFVSPPLPAKQFGHLLRRQELVAPFSP
ncbi:MAG: EAL domain-containing protein [Methylococcaceae bacterium]